MNQILKSNTMAVPVKTTEAFEQKCKSRLLNVKKSVFFFLFLFFCLYNPFPLYSAECFNVKPLFDISTDADQPSDIALSQSKDIYLVDGVNSRVIVFDSSGKFKFAFGRKGKGEGEFDHPLGIDISKDGKVLIADTRNHRIQVFDLKGSFLFQFSTDRESDRTGSDPCDVMISKFRDNIYVSDNDNHKIKIYSKTGDFQSEWGGFGENSGEFRYPGIMTGNSFNEIIVVDVINTRIQKFDPFGKHLDNVGAWGVLPGRFFRPKGVAVDDKDRLFTTDSYMGVVQVFSNDGAFLGLICENGTQKKYTTPVGIFVDQYRLYVVEMKNAKIIVSEILTQ